MACVIFASGERKLLPRLRAEGGLANTQRVVVAPRAPAVAPVLRWRRAVVHQGERSMKTFRSISWIAAVVIPTVCGCDESPAEPVNESPIITGISAIPDDVRTGTSSNLTCDATDPEMDPLTFTWEADAGTFVGTGASVSWTAPSEIGIYSVTCSVSDGRGGEDIESVTITVFSVEDTTVSVDTRSGPTSIGGLGPFDSGVAVEEGDSLAIVATGSFFNGAVTIADPNGGLLPPDPGFGLAILPEIATNSLVGSVGPSFLAGALLDDGVDAHPVTGETGTALGFPGLFGPGFTGSAFSARLPSGPSGTLHFAINDAPLHDNTGAIVVTITRIRRPKT